MNIPAKAVKAAARARHAREVQEGFFQSEKFQNWDTLGKEVQSGYLEAARAALEAAAPFIAAQALKGKARKINTHQFGPAAAPYISAIKAQIIADADELEATR